MDEKTIRMLKFLLELVTSPGAQQVQATLDLRNWWLSLTQTNRDNLVNGIKVYWNARQDAISASVLAEKV